MKKMKNLLALLLAAILVVGSVFSASAADITIQNAQPDHTYKAYQIFAGKVTNNEFSVTGWGDGVNGDALLAALKASTVQVPHIAEGASQASNVTIGSLFAGVNTAEGAAKVISTMNGHKDEMIQLAKIIDDHIVAAKAKTPTQGEKYTAVVTPVASDFANYYVSDGQGGYTPATGTFDETASYFVKSGDGNYSFANLPDGYWLILDETTGLTDQNDYLSANIIKLAGQNIKANAKGSGTTSGKGVTDEKVAPTNRIMVDNVQANIGDKVFYTLSGTTSKNLSTYDEYKWKFVDTLPAGITFYQIEDVYVGTATQTFGGNLAKIEKADWATYGITSTEPTNKATAEQAAGTADAPATGGGDLNVEIVLRDKTADPAIDHIGTEDSAFDILVVYSAVVNQAATQGGTYDATKNEMYVEFTNDPNGNGKGKTPKDEAVVYEVAIDLTKVSNTDPTLKLKGAEFILTRKITQGQTETVQYAKVDTTTGKLVRWSTNPADATRLSTGDESNSSAPYQDIIVKGIESGTYTLYEVKEPDGYNKPTLTKDGEGNVTGSNFSVQFTVTATGKEAADAGLSDLTVTGVTASGIPSGAATVSAKYTSVENPTGDPSAQGWYEKDEETNVFTLTEDTEVKAGKFYYTKNEGDDNAGTGSVSLGLATMTVTNSNNLTLPETGGIGTTIFYLVGAILVLGCAVLFVSKRRVSE